MFVHLVLMFMALHHTPLGYDCQTISYDTYPSVVVHCCRVGETFQCSKLKTLEEWKEDQMKVLCPCSSSLDSSTVKPTSVQ